MATRKGNNDGPVEVKDESQVPEPEVEQDPSTPEPGADQTSADAQAAFDEAVEEESGTALQVDRKRRTTKTTDHREAAAAKVAGPAPNSNRKDRKMVRLKLHNNKEIPPGGQHVGVNGNWVKIPPNEWVIIGEEFVEALDNAVRSEPVRNENNQVVEYRDVPRFPYTLDRNYEG